MNNNTKKIASLLVAGTVLTGVHMPSASAMDENVEPEIYRNIIEAESKGRALNESVVAHKEKYKYIKL